MKTRVRFPGLGARRIQNDWTNETFEQAYLNRQLRSPYCDGTTRPASRYSPDVAIVTDGHPSRWSKTHARRLREYQVPIYTQSIKLTACRGCRVQSLLFADGSSLRTEALFTTRGDRYFNQLAKMLGAKIRDGEIVVNFYLRTTIKRVYAAGCITPANCQMIIAAGQGATAAQSINKALFQESLRTHTLPRFKAVKRFPATP